MPANEIVALVGRELRRYGIAPPKVVRRGTHVDPTILQLEIDGNRIHTEFWEGSYTDEKLAEAILVDALCARWKSPAHEVRAQLEHERSQAQR